MKPAKEYPDVRVYFGGGFEDLIVSCVRASIHNDQDLWAANRHRDFTKFEGAGDLRDGGHKKNARCDLRGGIDSDKVSLGPRRASREHFWRIAVKVARVCRQGFVFAIEGIRRFPSKRPPRVGGSVDLDRRIYAQQIVETTDVVPVPGP